MSIFQKLYYKSLKQYHRIVIAANRLVYTPIASLYERTFRGTIVEVIQYNIFSSKYLFKYDRFQTIYNMMIAYWYASEYKPIKLEIFKAPATSEMIHEIVCWDGKRYLTFNKFEILKRITSNDRTRLLYAYICINSRDCKQNIDITSFMNRYWTSFTEVEDFKILDIIPILYAQKLISTSEMYAALISSETLIQAMDAISLQEITFKDNAIVI